MGGFTGLVGAVVLQQNGVVVLSLRTLMWGAIIGGGATFGIGYAMGALLTCVRPPLEDIEPP